MKGNKFILENGSVREVYFINEHKFIEIDSIRTVGRNHEIFETRENALYSNVITRLKEGNPLSNYKRSKYYEYYYERLKEDHPEYVI